MPKPDIQGHSMPLGELGMSFNDPSLLRGATAQLLIKNRSEIFSSNVLSRKDVSTLHQTTAVVEMLDDFFSHSWSTSRFDKWAALLLYMNAAAAAAALIGTALLWALLENVGLFPTLLSFTMSDDSQYLTSGMPMLMGSLAGVLCLFHWQRIRGILGYPPRMCFLDKVCIDQENETRKSAGIANLGAFLGSSSNFVVLFSPEYFTRLWCCYELAAFRHLQDNKQKITFLPSAFPRVLFAWACSMTVWSLPHALLPLYGPLLGIDPESVDTDTYNTVSYIAYPFICWTMYECQKYAAARESIDKQVENFSIERAECFDESDRPRVENEIAKWFGNGDRTEGIRVFNEYVRNDIRAVMEEMTGEKKTLSAGLPWVFLLLSCVGAILEDVGGLANMLLLDNWKDQLIQFMSCSSCLMVATPMIPAIFVWCASFSRARNFGSGWPMIFAAPVLGTLDGYLLIVTSISMDFTFCCVQYCFVMALGAVVFRDSIRQIPSILGLEKRGWSAGAASSQKQVEFAR